jgi:acyl-coenzyme A thioesterase PaaI-like protein
MRPINGAIIDIYRMEAQMDIPQLSLEKIKENRLCFGCGKDNPFGMKLKPYRDGDTARAEFTPSEYHQGWPGFAHGGALMTVLDEIIGYATFYVNTYNVTAKIEIRIKSMAKIGEPLIASAHIIKQSKRLLEVEADIKRKDGSVVAEASSIQFVV